MGTARYGLIMILSSFRRARTFAPGSLALPASLSWLGQALNCGM
jgi:hypothetical protein